MLNWTLFLNESLEAMRINIDVHSKDYSDWVLWSRIRYGTDYLDSLWHFI